MDSHPHLDSTDLCASFSAAALTIGKMMQMWVSEQSISVQVANAKAELARVRASEQNVRNFEALIRFKTIVAPYDGW